MRPVTTMDDLPLDMLLMIFSHLGTDEILNVAGVCRRFRQVSQEPSLWRRVFLHLNPDHISSFCDFLINNHLYPQTLCLTTENLWIPNRNARQSMENLFLIAMRLTCLTVENLDLRYVRLPATLKHLSVYSDSYPFDIMCGAEIPVYYLHRALCECPKIEKICVYAEEDFSQTFDTFLAVRERRIIENASKLTSLAMYPLVSEFVPMLQHFFNVKELGLYFDWENNDAIVQETDILPLAQFLHLELLYLRCDHELLEIIFRAFDNCTLPRVRHFSLIAQSTRQQRIFDFTRINRLFPNLVTYYAKNRCRRNSSDFHNFVMTCLNIKGIYYDYRGSANALFDYIRTILRLGETRVFDNLCFCAALNKFCNPNGIFVAKVPPEIRESLLRYSCGESHCRDLKFSKCYFRFPMVETRDPGKYRYLPDFSKIPVVDNEDHVWSSEQSEDDLY